MALTKKKPVIDVHVHVRPEGAHPGFVSCLQEQLSVHITGNPSKKLTAEAFRAKYGAEYAAQTVMSNLVKKMDEAGVDVSVLVGNDFFGFGEEPKLSIDNQNKKIAEFASEYPDRLVPLSIVDPRRPGAVGIIERAVKEYGAKGVGEWHPDNGFHPTSAESYRLLERLQEWNVILLTHTGFFFPPFRTRLVDPMLLDDVCGDFPNLKIIAAHAGRSLWWEASAHLCRVHPNLYADISGFQTQAQRDYPRFCHIMRGFLDVAGPEKFLFATDDPSYNTVGMHTKDYIRIIRELPEKAAPGYKFTEEEVDAVLGLNAKKLFGL